MSDTMLISSKPSFGAPLLMKWGARALVICAAGVVFTMLCVRESQINGRLATTPNYDDIVYFHNGAILLKSVEAKGFSGIQLFMNERGLHSPFSIFLAATAYGVLGFSDSAPYFANLLVILVYLAFISWFLRSLGFLDWMAALVLFLTPPFVTMGVVEFRPDIAWAVVTGFGVVWIVTSKNVFCRPGGAAAAGLFLALSLVIKPSTFVMTTILYTGAVVSRMCSGVWERRYRTEMRRALLGGTVFLATALILAGPYWFRFGGDTWQYFILNSFGANKAVWGVGGSFTDSLFFYVTGYGARSNVAISGMILSALAFVCLVFLAVKRPDLRWKLFVLLGLFGGALFINTLAEMKTPFVGGGIYGVWLFSCAYCIGTAYSCIRPVSAGGNGRWITILLILTAATAAFTYRWPEYSYHGGDRVLIENDRKSNAFMTGLLERHLQNPPKSIVFTQAGPIIMESVAIWLAARDIPCDLSWAAFVRNEQGFQATYPASEWVVMQEPGVMGYSPNMPSEPLLPKFEEIIRADANYHVIDEFQSLNGKKIRVYARQPAPPKP